MKAVLNHIGIVVHDVLEVARLLRLLGLTQLTKPELDPIQKVAACFLLIPNRLLIELLQKGA